jgi:hypothetical protein
MDRRVSKIDFFPTEIFLGGGWRGNEGNEDCVLGDEEMFGLWEPVSEHSLKLHSDHCCATRLTF